jgi:hypothetical protein
MLLKNGKSRPCRTGFSTQFSDKAMTATRRATFKLYPTRVVEVLLLYQRKLDRKTEYQKFGKSVLYSDKPNYLPAFKEQWIDYKNIDFLHAFQGTVGWGSL